LTLQWHHHRDN